MLIKNNGVTPITMNLRDGTSYLLAPGVPTSVPDAATTMIDDSAYLIGLFNAGTLTVTTDAGGAFSGFPTVVNATDSAVGKLLPVRAKVGAGGARTLVDETGQAVGGGGGSTNYGGTGKRRSIAARFSDAPHVQARSYAEEIAAGATSATVVTVGRIYRHSTGNLYHCITSGTLGTAEPTWVPAAYTGATAKMTATGGTAEFLDFGKPSRAATGRSKVNLIPLGANQAGGYAWKAGMRTINVFPTSSITDPLLISDGPQTANQSLFRSTNATKWTGTQNVFLTLRTWTDRDASTNAVVWVGGADADLECEVFSDAIGFQFNVANARPVIYVDGYPLTEDPEFVRTLSQNNACFVVEFPEGLSTHTIRVQNPEGLTAVYISSRGRIAPAQGPVIAGIVQGDSLMGTNMNWGFGPACLAANRILNALGINSHYSLSLGGTGYRAGQPYRHAVPVGANNPLPQIKDKASLYLFCHGNNDSADYTVQSLVDTVLTEVVANARTAWTQARASQANALIAVAGIWQPQANAGTANESMRILENALYDAWLDWKNSTGDTRTAFQRQFTDASGASASLLRNITNTSYTWSTSANNTAERWGQNMTSAVSGGNSAWYIQDSIHPTNFGVNYRVERMVQWLDEEMAKLGI